MKKQILLVGLVLLNFMGVQNSVSAFDGWFNKYDNDHDGKWNYDEFARAQRDWQIAHHQRVMSDRELRDYYEHHDKDRDGFWANEEARHSHHW